MDEEWEVEQIINSRLQNRMLQYLIKWKGYPTSENTWEPVKNVTNAPIQSGSFIKHSQKPPNATTFNSFKWKPLINYTIPQKKEDVRQILHSRGLVP